MTTQERLEALKREKTPYSTEELDRRGWTRYQEIRAELEDQHRGEYVAIEVDSGAYFLGKTPEEAFAQAEKSCPGKVFYLVRIGYKAAHKLKKA